MPNLYDKEMEMFKEVVLLYHLQISSENHQKTLVKHEITKTIGKLDIKVLRNAFFLIFKTGAGKI